MTIPSSRRRCLRLVVTGLLATVLLTGCGTGAAPVTTAAQPSTPWTAVAFPEPPASSPQTPANYRPGPAALGGPGTAPAGGPTNAARSPAPHSPGQGADGPFCAGIQSGLGTLSGNGLRTLKALATSAGGSVPALRAFVDQAQADLTTLRTAAPAAVQTAVQTLVSAWSTLSADLEKGGFGRAQAITLAIKYLTNPAVAAAWGALTGYTISHCGVDLGTSG